jgi:hypothetical protein
VWVDALTARTFGASLWNIAAVPGILVREAVMRDVTHFERFAEECIRLAQKQVYSRDRKILLLMARAWLLLAENTFSAADQPEEPPPQRF